MWDALVLFFFFSRRRRHTRFKCDWSSDVCSSDLTPSWPPPPQTPQMPPQRRNRTQWPGTTTPPPTRAHRLRRLIRGTPSRLGNEPAGGTGSDHSSCATSDNHHNFLAVLYPKGSGFLAGEYPASP